MAQGSTQFRVRLDDETAEVVRALSERLDRPCSKVLGEFIKDARPVLDATVALIDAASRAQDDARGRFVQDMSALDGMAQDFFKAFRGIVSEIEDAASQEGQEGPTADAEMSDTRARRGGGRPPYTNRGVVKENRQQVARQKSGKS